MNIINVSLNTACIKYIHSSLKKILNNDTGKMNTKNYKQRPFKCGNSYYWRWLYSAKTCYKTCRWM